jgi:mannose-6-phosphate isomerase-like protein (cupin superfamily)
MVQLRQLSIAALGCVSLLATDPTFLRRRIADVAPAPSDLTTDTARYRPVFGAGDKDARILRGIARFGELTVDAGGRSQTVNYPAEEQAWVVTEGECLAVYGDARVPVRKDDFMYLPPGVARGVENKNASPCRILVMGYRIPQGVKTTAPETLAKANINEVPKQVVGGHPPSTLYQLLMGTTESKRDRLATASVLTSLFIMNFAPGATNIPHHHETEEEIYLVLEGAGEMVAGGGLDGVEGRFPTTAGEAWFFRLNTTVGFYNGAQPARILAVRSAFPFRR